MRDEYRKDQSSCKKDQFHIIKKIAEMQDAPEKQAMKWQKREMRSQRLEEFWQE